MRRSLRLATLEGIPAQMVLGVTQSFLGPCALALGASSFQIGLVGALPNLGAALAQLKASALVRRLGSFKRVLVLVVGLGALPWLALVALPWLPRPLAVWALLVLATLALVLYHLPNAAWGGWVSHLVPARKRGKYLGLRSSLASIAALAAFLGGGALLDFLEGRVLLGFAAIFGVAAVARLVSLLLFSRMYEPPALARRALSAPAPASSRAEPHVTMANFLVAYGALLFASSLAGPFFAVYMLRDLGFSYTVFTISSVVPWVANIVAPRFWGPIADRRGNVHVMRLTMWGITLIPLLWTFSGTPHYIYVIQFLGSVAWAGFSLASLNFVYEASGEEDRTANIAHLYTFNGVAIFLGNLLGGVLVMYLPAIGGSSLLALFVLSSALRALALLLLWGRVQEVRRLPPPARPHWGLFHHLLHHRPRA